MHVREQIAQAVVTALTGLSTTGAHVFRDRDTVENPLQGVELPGIVVTDDGEPAEISSLGQSRLLERRMRLTVEAHVKALSGYSTQMNQILLEVEVAIANASLPVAKYPTLVELTNREIAEGGDTPCVRQAFHFEVFYITAHNAPDVAF